METFMQLLNLRDVALHALNAVILIVACRFLLYKPVRKFMDKRAQEVESQLQGAEQAVKEAETAKADLEAAQRKAHQEAAQAESKRLSEQSQAVLHKAQEDAEEILRVAKLQADAIQRQAQEDVQRQAVAMAVEMTQQMVGRELQDPDNQKMVRDFLTKVG